MNAPQCHSEDLNLKRKFFSWLFHASILDSPLTLLRGTKDKIPATHWPSILSVMVRLRGTKSRDHREQKIGSEVPLYDFLATSHRLKVRSQAFIQSVSVIRPRHRLRREKTERMSPTRQMTPNMSKNNMSLDLLKKILISGEMPLFQICAR